eukprot:TRINITY_DN2542_c0_g1_i1.p1 TRINITY_DN2542_c0_g1~~TRINITY_DN2542_c0_g1_i1.p1  ORF type:complete len:652 (+),score=121.82 TRINITY_DN2542_c0_g1_i1:41-1996(+)
MGLLAAGHTIAWKDLPPEIRKYVKRHGVQQFLAIYNAVKSRENDCLLWGDEVEYMLVHFDSAAKSVVLSLKADGILETLNRMEEGRSHDSLPFTTFLPEYAGYMVEATPGQPYHGDNTSFGYVEANMRLRRATVQKLLAAEERIITMPSFPLLGSGIHTDPPLPPGGPVTLSSYVSDRVISAHPRFSTLTQNIRERRGEKVNILVPLYMDVNTDPRQAVPADMPQIPDRMIHMDAMAFGMGCCCLQVTFQCPNIDDARYLYDQLSTLSPILLALTAAAPVFRGFLADVDVRWDVISASVDDRTRGERGLAPLQEGEQVIRKSRYDAISTYISNDRAFKPCYNDIELEIDQESLDMLQQSGVDDQLARHVAHLFIRDPLVVYNESIYVDDSVNTNHFENIQSTNWQTVRFKPPPAGSTTGWRVEFRSMEVQFTDFENAAFTVFIALLVRAILSVKLNFYIPMSKSAANMATAHHSGALMNEQFFFRRQVHELDGLTDEEVAALDDSFEKMTVNEIVNGKQCTGCPHRFIGLIGIVREFMAESTFDADTERVANQYLNFISKRASGELQGPATWMREFITKHEAYKKDSVVNQEIAHDLIHAINDICSGERREPALLGDADVTANGYVDGIVKFGSGGCSPAKRNRVLSPKHA